MNLFGVSGGLQPISEPGHLEWIRRYANQLSRSFDDSAPAAWFIVQPQFLGNLMRRLTLSASQNYLGALRLALLSLSGFIHLFSPSVSSGPSAILAATRLISEFDISLILQ
jgi:hypothetical protein